MSPTDPIDDFTIYLRNSDWVVCYRGKDYIHEHSANILTSADLHRCSRWTARRSARNHARELISRNLGHVGEPVGWDKQDTNRKIKEQKLKLLQLQTAALEQANGIGHA